MEKDNEHINQVVPNEVILSKYIWDTASEEEKLWIEDWLQENENNEKVLLQLASIDYALQTKHRIESRNSLDAYAKVQKHIKRLRIRKLWNHVGRIAACFLGVVILSTAISFWIQKDSMGIPQIITVETNAGMRTHFNLPDGTVAYLNSGSVLSYPIPYDKKERRVELKGEAYFEVASNPEQPFVVSVAKDKLSVKALGTEFNVEAHEEDNEVQTTLVSGSVEIGMKQENNEMAYRILSPSEKAIYDLESQSINVLHTNVDSEIGWKDGVLIFKDMDLPKVLKELSYFYNVKFEVLDPVINTYRFTGTFKNRQLTQILDYLQISSHVGYSIKQMDTDDSVAVQQECVFLFKKK